MLLALGLVLLSWGITLPLLLHSDPVSAQHIHDISLLRYPGIACLTVWAIWKARASGSH
jgi:hypothetical protein